MWSGAPKEDRATINWLCDEKCLHWQRCRHDTVTTVFYSELSLVIDISVTTLWTRGPVSLHKWTRGATKKWAGLLGAVATRRTSVSCPPPPPHLTLLEKNGSLHAGRQLSDQCVYKTPFEASVGCDFCETLPPERFFFVSLGFWELLWRPLTQNHKHA